MKIRYKYSKLYWLLRDFEWVGVYFSPFKPIIPRFYIGKTKIGVPYFLPRKWIKFTYEDCVKSAGEHLKKHPKASELVPYDTLVDGYKNYTKAVPMKIGFSSCGLGWKTKWTDIDFRHEWNPVISFVAFGYQIALIFRPEHDMHFWESYLFYSKATDKSKSAKERIEEARREFPCKWSSYSGDEKVTTDYWELILKSRYK